VAAAVEGGVADDLLLALGDQRDDAVEVDRVDELLRPAGPADVFAQEQAVLLREVAVELAERRFVVRLDRPELHGPAVPQRRFSWEPLEPHDALPIDRFTP